MRAPPEWLARLEDRFGDAIRAPLTPIGGVLSADTSSYADSLCAEIEGDARERIAVYHRQVWFRLLLVLHSEFPLTSRALGYWTFNTRFALPFLAAHPPSSHDLRDVADGFWDHLLANLSELDSARVDPDLVQEAARIDEQWRTVWAAPEHEPWSPTVHDWSALRTARLQASKTWAIVSERWPLVELRGRWAASGAPDAVGALRPHASKMTWAVVRRSEGMACMPLSRAKAGLWTLLATQPLSRALAELEASSTAEERADLLANTRAWLEQSVQLGLWTGYSNVGARP